MKRTSRPRRNPPQAGPAWSRRYSLPFDDAIEGEAQVHYAAELDRCHIIAPSGNVRIGASHLEQCVIVEPCTIGANVRAVAAILQGVIGDGCQIGQHSDVRGSLMEDVTLGVGVVVDHGAVIGPGADIGDMTVVHEEAEVGAGAVVGAQSDIGERAFVMDGGRVPSRGVVRPGSHLEVPSDTRQGGFGPPQAQAQIVADLDLDHSDEGEGDDEEEWEENDDDHPVSTRDWEPPSLSVSEYAKPGGMARGRPRLIQEDFQPGTARSWVLSKLGRLANVKSKDGRLSKKLVQEWRPDLLDHPVTKEVLRITPPVTDQQLSEMSFEALSKARYDVYGGVSFHSGATSDWQMIGPKANDVFVFAVPDAVIDEMLHRMSAQKPRPRWIFNHDGETHYYEIERDGGIETLGIVYWTSEDEIESGRPWASMLYGSRSGEWTGRGGNEKYLDPCTSLDEAKKLVEDAVSSWKITPRSAPVGTFDNRVDWHPDKGVKQPVGWVRLLVYPRQTVVVVEIQSDQSWLEFKADRLTPLQTELRAMYFNSFAADALNFVVEWAFNKRYGEVLVLDHASRKRLGGDPPKSFYDDLPKKYTVSAPVPLDGGPMDYIRLYDWVPKDLKVRRIIPNRG